MGCQTERSRIALDARYVNMITNVSKEFRLDPECMIPLLINTIFNSREKKHKAGSHEIPRAMRKKTDIQCFVKLCSENNEIYYLPGLLADISLFGVRVVVDDEYGEKEHLVKKARQFELTTCAGHENRPVSFLCRLRHISRGRALSMGGALVTPENHVVTFFLKILLGFETTPNFAP